jgi:hypothetical protein
MLAFLESPERRVPGKFSEILVPRAENVLALGIKKKKKKKQLFFPLAQTMKLPVPVTCFYITNHSKPY